MFWPWKVYLSHKEDIGPLLAPMASLIGSGATLLVGVIVARAALRQARTATQQARIAAKQARVAGRRHKEQTKADFQRRITEGFTKAVELLGSDKLQVRVGGIFALERISRESSNDYWTIMETLTAFVRERARWKASSVGASETAVETSQQSPGPPPTDVAVVLNVIARRACKDREREKDQNWRINLRGADLRGASIKETDLENADLADAHLEGANLRDAHLEGANLNGAHLEGADLSNAHLEYAVLLNAHLEGATLYGAHFEDTNLYRAHLTGVNLYGVHLNGANLNGANLYDVYFMGANLKGAHLEGADLSNAHLEGADLGEATGNSWTRLPREFPRPPHWPAFDPG